MNARDHRILTALVLTLAVGGCGATSVGADGSTNDAPAGDGSSANDASDASTGSDVTRADVASNDATSDTATVSDTGSGATDAGSGSTDAGTASDGGLTSVRPYRSKIPMAYDQRTAWPLIILLHGYGADGAQQDLYFQLGAQVDAKGFLYAYPDGLLDSQNRRYWNATDACCNFDHTSVDDVAYITAIIDDMSARYTVDPHKVFIVGHSNGAFMSHRMACDRSDRIAAIVALAGDNWDDVSHCTPTSTVSVLQVHGTSDAVIAYNGGDLTLLGGARFPSAMESIGDWVTLNGCGPIADTGMTMDLESAISGNETHVSRADGCRAGGAAELWTIQGGSHIPAFQPTWAPTIVDWLYAHPKP